MVQKLKKVWKAEWYKKALVNIMVDRFKKS